MDIVKLIYYVKYFMNTNVVYKIVKKLYSIVIPYKKL